MIQCNLKNLFTRSLNSGGSCRNARLSYLISGVSEDEKDPGAAALQAVSSTAPAELDGADLSRITLTKSYGGGIYEAAAEYERSTSDRNSRKKIGDRQWIFDTTGGREQIYHGTLLKSKGSTETDYIPDPGTLINWNGRNGEKFYAAGTTRIVPSMRESCIAVFRASDITASFRRKVMALTGCVNSSTFHSWQPGEVLFLGASSSLPFRNDNGVKITEVTFRFAVRCNVTSLEVGGVQMGAAEGWDLPWSISLPHSEGYAPVTAGAYLSSIYEKGDFSVLKI